MALSKPARLFIEELISEFKDWLEKFKSKTSDRSTQPELDEKALELLQAIDRTADCVSQFFKQYPSWIQERRECIEQIRESAESIDWHHHNVNIVKLPTAAAGIAGGVLTIAGLALAPVTAGVSLGLTIAGAAVGGTAAVTGVTSSVTEVGIKFRRVKKAQECVKKHQSSTETINKIINSLLEGTRKVNELATQECLRAPSLNQIMEFCEVIWKISSFIKTIAQLLIKALKSLPQFAEELAQIHSVSSAGVTVVAGATSIAGSTADDVVGATAKVGIANDVVGATAKAGIADDVVGATAKAGIANDVVGATAKAGIADDVVGATAKAGMSTGARVSGFVFSGIGIAFDLTTFVYTSYDIYTGSKTSAAKDLRKLADHLGEEMQLVEQIYTMLSTNEGDQG